MFEREILGIFKVAYMTVFPDEKLRKEFKRVVATWKGGLFSNFTWKELQEIIDRCEPKSRREPDQVNEKQRYPPIEVNTPFLKDVRHVVAHGGDRNSDQTLPYTTTSTPFYGYPSMSSSSATYPETGFPMYTQNQLYLTDPYASFAQQRIPYHVPSYSSSLIHSLPLSTDLTSLLNSTTPTTLPIERQSEYSEPSLGISPSGTSHSLLQLTMVLKRLGLLNISNHLERLTNSLRDEGAVSLLYESLPIQCKICALRFSASEEGNRLMAEHLDWHYRRNKRIREQLKRATSRGWFLSDKVSDGLKIYQIK